MEKEISEKDFEAIYWIEHMKLNNSLKLSSQLGISEKEAEEKLTELKEKELIDIENREGKIHSSQLTKKGKQIWDDEKYLNWKTELGY